ncbi:MAG: LiaI-LiaF-like domain-containing protein [Bryobacteraceae bacterium]
MSTQPGITGYCRACGKALDESTMRTANGTIYCEEHVPIEVPKADASPYTAKTPPPAANPHVSPGVAFVLGFIPGVGAIYNGQYAKGLVHVIIVGLIISIIGNNAAGGLEPLLGLLLAAFWMYMAFEAFHTAKRRQEGLAVDEFSSLVPMRPGSSRLPVAPLVLIAVGVILLLENLGLLDLHQVLRYWPALLIALGVYLLLLRIGSWKRADKEPPR